MPIASMALPEPGRFEELAFQQFEHCLPDFFFFFFSSVPQKPCFPTSRMVHLQSASLQGLALCAVNVGTLCGPIWQFSQPLLVALC